MKNLKRENVILVASLIFFMFFVGYLVFQQARQGDLVLNQNDVINFFSSKINELSPEKPVSGGKWAVKRFRFVDANNVYVEYGDGQAKRAFLLTLNKTVGTVPDYKILGYFEPGQLEYKLLAGEDSAKGKPQEIYEYNDGAKKWLKVN